MKSFPVIHVITFVFPLLVCCFTARGESMKRGEIFGISVPMSGIVRRVETGGPALVLSKKQEEIIKLKDTLPGTYHLAVRLRTGDLTEKSEKTMLGGYNFLFPESNYGISVKGKSLSFEVSPRMPRVVYQVPNSEQCVLAGWVYSQEPVEIKSGQVIKISCAREGGMVFEMVLLDEAAWEAEKVRSSGLYKDPGGVGWALGWFNVRPREWYHPETVQNVVAALDKFQKGEAKPFLSAGSLDILISQGKGLKKAIEDLKKNEGRLRGEPAIIRECLRLAGEWKKYFDQVDHLLGKDLAGVLGKIDGTIKPIKVNEQCYAGREAAFNRRTALAYIEGAKREIVKFGNPEDLYKKNIIKALTYTQNAADFGLKAKEWAGKSQVEVPLVGYEVKTASPAGIAEKTAPQSQLCLNGLWNYSVEGGPEKPPAKWDATFIPNGSWQWAVNKLHVTDDEWGKRIRMYWWWEDAVWYKTQFTVPKEWSGRKIAIDFENVIMYCAIFINGRYCGNHYGGFVPFEFDITEKTVPGQVNNLLVYVQNARKTKRPGTHPLTMDPNLYPTQHEGGSNDGGIRGDVFLRSYPAIYVKDVFVRTLINGKKLIVAATVANSKPTKEKIKISNLVRQEGKDILPVGEVDIELAPRSEKAVTMEKNWLEVKMWGVGGEYGSPENLYYLSTRITQEKIIDERFTQFGFRQLQTKGLHFILNGRQIWLQGSQVSSNRRDLALHNQWLAAQLLRIFRQANVVFVRMFHASIGPMWYRAANWIGIIMEGESPWWRFHPPLDILGRPDHLDPVWLENCRRHYEGVIRQYRNQPSFMIYSAENESLNDEEALEAGAKFVQWIKQAAPETIVDCNSCSTAWDRRFEICNLHDYGIGADRMQEWVRLRGDKPIIIGEFWNYAGQTGVKSSDPVQARGADNMMGKWLARQIREYQSVPCAGIVPFEFVDMGSTYSNADPKVMGPWADLIQKGKPIVRIPWPSFSGTGGYRFDKMLAGAWTMNVNFFDPVRPVFTPTEAYKGLKNGYRSYPGWGLKRPPELLVRVLEKGKPCDGINVFLMPAEGQSMPMNGVKADKEGTAWFLLDEPGKYIVEITKDAKTVRKEVVLKETKLDDRAGFDYISRLTVDLDAPEKAVFEEKKESVKPAGELKLITSQHEKPTPLVEKVPTMEISPDGFIRRWMICGPFPNSGGRKKPELNKWDTDLLLKNGGEKNIEPVSEMVYDIRFEEDEFGYWKPGVIKTSWKSLVSSDDFVDLGKAFVHREFSGLECPPVQYVIGYAACYIESDKDQDCIVATGSDDGLKVWLNHEILGKTVLFRNIVKDDDKFKGHLVKGRNLLLLKVNQDIGDYLFCVRLFNTEGKPIFPKMVDPPKLGAGKKAVVPFSHDFIRTWLVCGPFPNGSGRPKCESWDTDFLRSSGGEQAVEPVTGMSYQSKFVADPIAGRTAAEPTVMWKVFESKTDIVNLGQIFVLPGLEGLDFAPVQYVVGYAACEIQSDRPRKCRMELHTLDAAKVWLNHELIFDKHLHRTVKDTGSVLLQQFKGEPFIIEANLRQGPNQLLLKLDCDFGEYGFKLRFIE